MKRVSATQAKAHLSTLMAEVAHGGQQILIEKRGRPLAALVSVADLGRLGSPRAPTDRPAGALALAGAWSEVDETELDRVIDEIYGQRAEEIGRPVEVEE